MSKRFVLLVETPAGFDVKYWQVAEGPKTPFDSVTLATEREIGLFVRPCLPREPKAEE